MSPERDSPKNKDLHLAQRAITIRSMFDAIAGRYDFLNRLLSLGIDLYWRKRCIAFMKENKPFYAPILDLAAGTGDLSLALERAIPGIKIIATDFSLEMLRHLRKKRGISSRIEIVTADGSNLPFKSASFGATMIGFGIRNFTRRERALKEIHRVLKPGGILTILEFSLPRNKVFRSIYSLYFEKILPLVGGLFSNRSAYKYLPESVKTFPDPMAFSELISRCLFTGVRKRPLTGGIATLYIAKKPIDPSEKNR